jgi:hypothetical protein
MDWLAYFERNRHNRMEILWAEGIHIDDSLRTPLIASLQRFQVGESGEGKHLKKAAAAVGDPDYAKTISLFIAEEQEHSRLLAKLLEVLNAPLITQHWSDIAFILIRRMAGLRLELMILLIAEMIAKRYYRTLYEGSHDAVLRTTCAQILRDEVGHVAFHCDTLHRSLSPLPRPLKLTMCAIWWLAYRVVCVLVMIDHWGVIQACGTPFGVFWRDCGRIFDETAAAIFFRPAPLPRELVRASATGD